MSVSGSNHNSEIPTKDNPTVNNNNCLLKLFDNKVKFEEFCAALKQLSMCRNRSTSRMCSTSSKKKEAPINKELTKSIKHIRYAFENPKSPILAWENVVSSNRGYHYVVHYQDVEDENMEWLYVRGCAPHAGSEVVQLRLRALVEALQLEDKETNLRFRIRISDGLVEDTDDGIREGMWFSSQSNLNIPKLQIKQEQQVKEEPAAPLATRNLKSPKEKRCVKRTKKIKHARKNQDVPPVMAAASTLQLENDFNCPSCQEDIQGVPYAVLSPCGHCVCTNTCYPKLQNRGCPICRAAINANINVSVQESSRCSNYPTGCRNRKNTLVVGCNCFKSCEECAIVDLEFTEGLVVCSHCLKGKGCHFRKVKVRNLPGLL